MDLTKNEKFDWVSILPYIFSILFLGLLFVVLMKYPFLNVDEGFTRGFMDFSFAEMIKLTAMDVHPPVYYLITMAFVKLCHALSLNFNLIQMMKIPSIIPYLILVIISLTKLRKDYGLLSAGVFCLAMIALSEFFTYYLIARMYTWAMLFIVIAFLFVKDILEKNNYISWILFSVFSILAAYTHYFSILTTVVVYIMLFIWIVFFKERKDLKSNLIKLFGSALLCVILYVPWIPTLINQLHYVHGNFFISKVTFSDLVYYISYGFTISGNQLIQLLSVLAMIVIFIMLLKKFHETRSENDAYLLIGFIAFIGTIFLGFIASILYKPILYDRYILHAVGVLLLVLSIKLGQMKLKKSHILLIIILISVVGAFNVYHEIKDIQKMNDKTIKEANVLAKINNNDSIVIYDTENHYIRTHMDLDNIYEGYDNVSIIKYQHNLTYKFDDLNHSAFVIPDDISKYPDKDVYFMRFYTMPAKFPNNVNATDVGTAQHATFYKLKMK